MASPGSTGTGGGACCTGGAMGADAPYSCSSSCSGPGSALPECRLNIPSSPPTGGGRNDDDEASGADKYKKRRAPRRWPYALALVVLFGLGYVVYMEVMS